MALSKIKTASMAADAVDNTILDLTSDYAFTGTVTGASALGDNMVINGGMIISQRGTTFASTANTAYTLDRMQWYDTGAGVVDISQSTDTPNGNFKNSLKVDVTTADSSLAAGDLYNILTRLEGYTIAHLGWGTSAAKTVTLSFYIKSPKTGTHSVVLRNSDSSRTRVEEFTVSAANTWERKTITIPGDTGGTWQSNHTVGLQLIFPLAAGSTFHAASTVGSWGTDSNNSGNIYASSNQVNCMDDAANNWYITGIQLEEGPTATAFKHEDYATTLRKCHRYYFRTDSFASAAVHFNIEGFIYTDTQSRFALQLPTVLRSQPTITLVPAYNTGSDWQTNIAGIGNKAWTLTATIYLTGGAHGTGASLSPRVDFYVTNSTWSNSTYWGRRCQPFSNTGVSANYIEADSEF
tara:strand:- start:4603 stop:5826 length:1224 start_codon:yes stop_codon:yes gene_type:complete